MGLKLVIANHDRQAAENVKRQLPVVLRPHDINLLTYSGKEVFYFFTT